MKHPPPKVLDAANLLSSMHHLFHKNSPNQFLLIMEQCWKAGKVPVGKRRTRWNSHLVTTFSADSIFFNKGLEQDMNTKPLAAVTIAAALSLSMAAHAQDGAAAGATTGTVTGAIVGGPVGAAVEYGVTKYRYTVVNDRTVLVDPSTHRIVQVID
jgi:hypothetical protein